MWEVFALTSLIFTALGIVEYRKGRRNINFYSKKEEKEVRLVHSHTGLEEIKEPKQFIKLRLGEEKKEESKPSLLNNTLAEEQNQRNKEDAKRIWENHYIVKAVKERFAKGEEKNYGVFNEDVPVSERDSFEVKKETNVQLNSHQDVTSSLPVVPIQENTSEKKNNEESNSTPSGVFGSLLKERELSTELNLVNEKQEEIKKEEKKGEEFNPFDVLGGF